MQKAKNEVFNNYNAAGHLEVWIGGKDQADASPFGRFEEATRHLLQVPKREAEKAELRAKKEREARKADKPQDH
jgi:hypothetical protein